MIAQQAPTIETRYHRLEVTNRWLIGIGAVLVVALIALVAYVALDRLSVSANERTVESVQAALAAGDFEEYQSYYSTDMISYGPESSEIGGYAGMQAGWDTFHRYDTVIEGTGETVAYGNVVLYPFRWSNNLGLEGEGINVYKFDADGQIVADVTLLDE